MNKWKGLIQIRKSIIASLKFVAMKENRIITEQEQIEIATYQDEIERFRIYNNVGI